MVALKIAVEPASATAKLDGVALAQNPFVAQMPRDGSAHTLEVSAPGYVTQTSMLSYERDIDLTIKLVETAAPTATASATTAPPEPGKVAPFPDAKVPPPAPSGNKPLGIDEDDPYK
jgi:serine/threonine-protein kinase